MNYYDGIVVTHGTDTMAYTSSMISFMIQNPKIPVVFTGSQLPISHPLTDAIANLRYALSMALSKIRGIYLAFDRKIILGCRAVKVRTTAFHAFESVNIHSVATIDSSGLSIRESQLFDYKDETLFNTNLEDRVFLLKLTPGTNPEIIDLLIQSNIKGIVIEAFGAGGVQAVRRDFVSAIAKASKHNIPVVVTSQCLYEQANLNIYQVGTNVLKQGAIEALDMTTEAAVTKLMWVLGQTNDLNEIRKYFSTSLAGEITL
jgi:L-asparaginase